MMSTSGVVCGVIVSASLAVTLAACDTQDHSQPLPLLENSPPTSGAAGEPSVGPSAPTSPLFKGAAVHAEHVAPVIGGTLSVTRDGATIVAADPDRDAVFLVDAVSKHVRPIVLQRGDEPGRIVEGVAGKVYVALRRAGALATIDVASGALLSRTPVCASPRGLAYDAAHAQLVVACRSGLLLTLDASDLSQKRAVQLDTDLRDVIVRPNDLVVTRFLSSEVMVVAGDGSVSRRAVPDPEPGCGSATVAFRALALSSGQIAVGHQASSDEVVQPGSGGYGFSCGGGLVNRFITLVDVDTSSVPNPNGIEIGAAGASSFDERPLPMTFSSSVLPGAGPLDIAVDEKTSRFAAIALDDSIVDSSRPSTSGPQFDPSGLPVSNANLWVSQWTGVGAPVFSTLNAGDFTTPNPHPVVQKTLAGQPVAVAFDGVGRYVVQSREPATLEFEDGSSVSLSAESHADTGQVMFYMNSGIGISCSSCHPEGGEDGHVWHFNEGSRRTMPLEGGVMERAPFHWDGTLSDMSALVNEVMLSRMALPALPNEAQIAALGSFLEQLPSLPAAEGLDQAAVARGEALFRRADVACASCHSGPQYTNNQMADVGTGGMFSTPSLIGAGLRTALFHDGCAKTIEDRFGPCGGVAHGKPELLTEAEKAEMIVFLRSL
ncbi:MAG: cytochrome-c peroxidase [Polyangiaceae bacterium]